MTKKMPKNWFYKGLYGLLWGRIRGFKDYILEIESKFQSDIKDLHESYDKEITQRNATDDEASHIAEYYGDQLYIIEGIFLRVFRYSVLVSIYSFLESSMLSICRHLKQIKQISLEVSDLRGEGIEREKIYLEKVCGVAFPEKSHEWQEIKKFARVRNCIVHAEGNTNRDRNPDTIKSIVKSTPGLKLENDRYIVIDRKYIDKAIQWVEDFLKELHNVSLKETS